MNDRERKMMAFIAGVLDDLARGLVITDDELIQLNNIATELGYLELDEKEFRY